MLITYQQSSEHAESVVDTITALGRRALALRADSAEASALVGTVEAALDAFGRIDILVNNAAVFVVEPVESLDPTEGERTIAVNVRAPFVAAQATAGHMPSGRRIISIGSNLSERTVFPGFTLYAMSKTALIGMTEDLARELGPRGITANLVNPGPADTDTNPADGPHADTIRGLTALGRYAAPDEIAATVAFLAGDAAQYITGAVINVDGGSRRKPRPHGGRISPGSTETGAS